MRESYDEIYNGPPKREPRIAQSLGDIGTDTDSAFALGREICREGYSRHHLTKHEKGKPKEWVEALRKGYSWQLKRTKK